MKKAMIIVALLPTIACGMDKTFELFLGKTKICVTTKSLYDADGMVDAIIVGKHEQLSLNRNASWLEAGYLSVSSENKVRVNSYERVMKSTLFFVSEPKLDNPCYQEQDGTIINRYYYQGLRGDAALAHAKEDLCTCYKNILVELVKKMPGMVGRKIAIQALSTKMGFPCMDAAVIAANTMGNFVLRNPSVYSLIYIAVKEYAEFEKYQRELEALYQRCVEMA